MQNLDSLINRHKKGLREYKKEVNSYDGKLKIYERLLQKDSDKLVAHIEREYKKLVDERDKMLKIRESKINSLTRKRERQIKNNEDERDSLMDKYPHISKVSAGKAIKRRLRQVNIKNKYELMFMKYLDSLDIEYEYQKIFFTDDMYYIVDFYVPKNNVVFECDGKLHEKREFYDEKRTDSLKTYCKIKEVYRFWNTQIENYGNEVLDTISRICD